MKSLSKVTSVMLALSVAWFGGVMMVASRDISNFRGTNEFLTQVNFDTCAKAQRADCEAERVASDQRVGDEIHQIWMRVFSWALGPPALLLLLTWFLFERRTRQVASARLSPSRDDG